MVFFHSNDKKLLVESSTLLGPPNCFPHLGHSVGTVVGSLANKAKTIGSILVKESLINLLIGKPREVV